MAGDDPLPPFSEESRTVTIISYEDVDVLELLDGIRVDKLPGWAEGDKPAAPLRTIKIFLASSAELREDRDAFDLYFRQRMISAMGGASWISANQGTWNSSSVSMSVVDRLHSAAAVLA